jgi:hypothetical protein
MVHWCWLREIKLCGLSLLLEWECVAKARYGRNSEISWYKNFHAKTRHWRTNNHFYRKIKLYIDNKWWSGYSHGVIPNNCQQKIAHNFKWIINKYLQKKIAHSGKIRFGRLKINGQIETDGKQRNNKKPSGDTRESKTCVRCRSPCLEHSTYRIPKTSASISQSYLHCV